MSMSNKELQLEYALKNYIKKNSFIDLKIGDKIKVYPSKRTVKIINVKTKRQKDIKFLRNYWNEKYNIVLPKSFNIIQVCFSNSEKIYDYPLFKDCLIKP